MTTGWQAPPRRLTASEAVSTETELESGVHPSHCQRCNAMIRVTSSEERGNSVITVDGELTRASIEPVETCCHEAMLTGPPVRLFLRDVSRVDHAGRALLQRLAAKGVQLLAAGIYTS
jgi:ABC-type transporter Mla MlaB component